MRSLPAFIAVGLAATGTYFAILYLLEAGWSVDYRIAASAAYVASGLVHFFLNRRVTFGQEGRAGMTAQVLRYLGLVAINYALNLATVVACVEWLHWSVYPAVVLSMVFTVSAGYMLARFWVFPRQ